MPTNSIDFPGDAIKHSAERLMYFRDNIEQVQLNNLKNNISLFKGMKGDNFTLTLIFFTKILTAGGTWDSKLSKKGYANDDASFLKCSGNKITDFSLQMSFLADFSAPITSELQNPFKAGGNINKVSSGIDMLQDALKQYGDLLGGKGSSTYTTLDTALNSLKNSCDQIKAGWGTDPSTGQARSGTEIMAAFMKDVGSRDSGQRGSDSASNIFNEVTQQIANMTQTTQTLNGTLGTKLQYEVGNQEQWQSLTQGLLKAFMQIWSTTTNNQKN